MAGTFFLLLLSMGALSLPLSIITFVISYFYLDLQLIYCSLISFILFLSLLLSTYFSLNFIEKKMEIISPFKVESIKNIDELNLSYILLLLTSYIPLVLDKNFVMVSIASSFLMCYYFYKLVYINISYNILGYKVYEVSSYGVVSFLISNKEIKNLNDISKVIRVNEYTLLHYE